MPDPLILGADLVAVVLLAYGVYYRRHRRRDMLLAYVGLNVGVLAVTTVLAGATVGAGLGLGLFGVLSIIRLRSSEISQQEVAYYFASLALGLIGGMQPDPRWLGPVLSAAIVAVMFVVDHETLNTGHRQQVVTLDAVYPDEAALIARLEDLLHAEVQRVVVQQTDLVRDLTVVDVRYRLRPPTGRTSGTAPSEGVTRAGLRSTAATAATEAAEAPAGASAAAGTEATDAWSGSLTGRAVVR